MILMSKLKTMKILVSQNNTCDGYVNFAPEYRSINSGTCESNGYQNLISAHECSQASNELADIREEGGSPKGCFVMNGQSMFNSYDSSTAQIGENNIQSAWCKQ